MAELHDNYVELLMVTLTIILGKRRRSNAPNEDDTSTQSRNTNPPETHWLNCTYAQMQSHTPTLSSSVVVNQISSLGEYTVPVLDEGVTVVVSEQSDSDGPTRTSDFSDVEDSSIGIRITPYLR